jgi:hypothetical protein
MRLDKPNLSYDYVCVLTEYRQISGWLCFACVTFAYGCLPTHSCPAPWSARAEA